MYRKWQRNIPRVDKPLERNAAVCELHFNPQFVSRHFEHIISGELVRLERSRPLLQPDAILTIFPNVPKYISKPVSNMTSWYESLYPTKCKGLVSGPEKCCIVSKYLRRLLLNQRCRARQLKRKENYARKLKARTQTTVRAA
ncbi:hypothetical protein HPB49_003671 [Dermacentor silvarum]|uniref:Uncharacterized protein n=1 Tax=Dermacentor silvarum TaxID=543639 RepID=A0ACB8CUY8_DERSI|nr:hypothetical protein HPB49_003671 [Dermacentor silvarum]